MSFLSSPFDDFFDFSSIYNAKNAYFTLKSDGFYEKGDKTIRQPEFDR